MPAQPGHQSLNTWQPRTVYPMFLYEEHLTIQRKQPDERFSTASNIAANYDMIKMSTKGMKTAIDLHPYGLWRSHALLLPALSMILTAFNIMPPMSPTFFSLFERLLGPSADRRAGSDCRHHGACSGLAS
jgi:hypothetical protein